MGSLAIGALVGLVMLGGTAAADNRAKADALFREGKRLMADKRYADACAAFEESVKLDPGIGGELNIGKCFEDWGKLGRALRSYQRAEAMAKDSKDPRLERIQKLIAQLEPTVPHLTLKVPPGADLADVTINLDGAPLDKGELGSPQLVDPGPHLVEWKVQDRKRSRVIPIERGGASEVMLELPTRPVEPGSPAGHDEHPVATTPVGSRSPAADPGRTRRYYAYGLGGAGGVAVVVSGLVTWSAKRKYDDALAKDCGGMTTTCDPAGLTATHAARHEANVATFVFLVGAGAIGAGAYLYFTAPHAGKRAESNALYLAPAISADGAGLVLGGPL
jgi:tetratricopeptide (TPR) repeat protein